MEILFIIIAFVVVVITINISISITIEYDIFKNIGKLIIKAFKIPVFTSEISLIAGYFNLIRKNHKVLQIKVDLNDKNFKFIKDISNYFTKKIIITDISTNFSVSGDNPHIVATFAGYIMAIEGVIRSYTLCKLPDAVIKSKTYVRYKENGFKFQLCIGVLITIFDFIWAIVRASVKRSLYGKTKFRRKRQFDY